MHQRSTVGRAWLSGAIGLLLVSGCLPTPNHLTAASLGREGTIKTTLPKGTSGSPVLVTAGQTPTGQSTPVPPPTILSNNGANILRGAVRAPASIISHNGGNIVSNNGGSIVSNNGGSIISHNGGNVISNNGSNLQIAQVPLAYTTVRLKDAAGNAVKDDKGNELVTKTDAEGNYSFPVDVKGRNLVIEADVDGQSGKLKSLLPKDGLQAGVGLDVDLTSTLTLAYILDQYVKGDLATFERLPKDIEAKARTVTESAIVEKGIELPSSLEGGAIVAKVDEVRKADPTVDQVFEEIRKLLVVAGFTNEGDGLPSNEVDPGRVGGLIQSGEKYYVFSQSKHTLWSVTEDSILHTIVENGKWGYGDKYTDTPGIGYTSGLALDFDGSIVLADTYNDRVVRVLSTGQVQAIAGDGVPGDGGDGGPARLARVNKPSGLVIDDKRNIIFSDSENNRVRKIDATGKITTIVGDGVSGMSGDGGDAILARLRRPEGLVWSKAVGIYIADYGNGRIRRLDPTNTITTVGGDNARFQSPIVLGLDDDQSLKVLNFWNDGVYQLTPAGIGQVNNGPIAFTDGTIGQLFFPCAFAINAGRWVAEVNDNVLVQIDGNNVVRQIMGFHRAKPSGTTIIGASSIAVGKSGDIYLADDGARRILKVTQSGQISVVAGNGQDEFVAYAEKAVDAPVGTPYGLALTADDNVLISSIGKHPVIQEIGKSGELFTIAGNGHYDYLKTAAGRAVDTALANPDNVLGLPDGSIIFSESEFNNIYQVNSTGEITNLIPPNSVKAPHHLTLDADGNICFVEWYGHSITRIKGGQLETILGEDTIKPWVAMRDIKGLCFDSVGNCFIAGLCCVIKVDSSKKVTLVAGQNGKFLSGATRDTSISNVIDMCFSPSGDLYILEPTQVKRINKEDLAGL